MTLYGLLKNNDYILKFNNKVYCITEALMSKVVKIKSINIFLYLVTQRVEFSILESIWIFELKIGTLIFSGGVSSMKIFSKMADLQFYRKLTQTLLFKTENLSIIENFIFTLTFNVISLAVHVF